MMHLVIICITLALMFGFALLADYESRKGIRYAAVHRAKLDAKVEHLAFVLTHVDFMSFLRDEALHFVHRASHDVAELTLRAVRAAERLLTRIVRSLRTQKAVDPRPQSSAREFIKKLSEFKGQLQRPEMPEIQ